MSGILSITASVGFASFEKTEIPMECFYTRIEIGGELNHYTLVQLLNAIGESGAWFELTANEDETAHIEEMSQEGRCLELSNDDQPWGHFEDLEAFCRGHNLTYRRETSPKDEYEGVIEH